MADKNASGFRICIASATGKRVEQIAGDSVTIGRSKENDITIVHGGISRKHVSIVFKGGQLLIMDLATTNGTKINQQKIPSQKWHSYTAGSQLELGTAPDILTVEYVEVDENTDGDSREFTILNNSAPQKMDEVSQKIVKKKKGKCVYNLQDFEQLETVELGGREDKKGTTSASMDVPGGGMVFDFEEEEKQEAKLNLEVSLAANNKAFVKIDSQVTIGSGDADFVVTAPNVAEHHATFFQINGALIMILHDDGRKNLWKRRHLPNDKKYLLKEGVSLELGPLHVRVVAGETLMLKYSDAKGISALLKEEKEQEAASKKEDVKEEKKLPPRSPLDSLRAALAEIYFDLLIKLGLKKPPAQDDEEEEEEESDVENEGEEDDGEVEEQSLFKRLLNKLLGREKKKKAKKRAADEDVEEQQDNHNEDDEEEAEEDDSVDENGEFAAFAGVFPRVLGVGVDVALAYFFKIVWPAPSLFLYTWLQERALLQSIPAELLLLLISLVMLQLTSTLILSVTVGQGLVGMRGGGENTGRVTGILRLLFAYISLPLIFLDIRLLHKRPSLKEKLSNSRLIIRSRLQTVSAGMIILPCLIIVKIFLPAMQQRDIMQQEIQYKTIPMQGVAESSGALIQSGSFSFMGNLSGEEMAIRHSFDISDLKWRPVVRMVEQEANVEFREKERFFVRELIQMAATGNPFFRFSFPALEKALDGQTEQLDVSGIQELKELLQVSLGLTFSRLKTHLFTYGPFFEGFLNLKRKLVKMVGEQYLADCSFLQLGNLHLLKFARSKIVDGKFNLEEKLFAYNFIKGRSFILNMSGDQNYQEVIQKFYNGFLNAMKWHERIQVNFPAKIEEMSVFTILDFFGDRLLNFEQEQMLYLFVKKDLQRLQERALQDDGEIMRNYIYELIDQYIAILEILRQDQQAVTSEVLQLRSGMFDYLSAQRAKFVPLPTPNGH